MQQISVLETNIGSSTTGNSANTQIIFNDAGTLRGDAGLTYNASTDTLTAGAATITGDLTVGTNALKVFPATNRVLINQTTAIQGDSLEVTSKSNAGAISLFGRASDNQSVISFRSNGAATQKAGIQGGDTGLEFVAGTTIKQTINPSTGDITVSLGNLVMGTSGKGIDFSAVTGGTGTATANVLNDYEEGTWTPVLRGSSVAGSYSFSFGVGKYTKIGRLVMVNVSFVDVTEITTGTGVIQITGLPFQIPNDDPGSRGVVGELLIRQCNALSTAKNMYVQGSAGSSIAYFNYFNGTDDVQVPIGTIISGQTDFGFTLTYNV